MLIRLRQRQIALVMEPMIHLKILSVLFSLLPKLQSFLWQVVRNLETLDIKIYDLKKLSLFSLLSPDNSWCEHISNLLSLVFPLNSLEICFTSVLLPASEGIARQT